MVPERVRAPATATVVAATLAAALAALAGVAAAQPRPVPEAISGLSPLARAVGGFVAVFVVAGLVALLAPRYADRVAGQARNKPLAAFGYGLVFGFGTVLVLAVLAATGIGMLVAVPGLVVFTVVALVGTSCGYLLLGQVVTGTRDSVGVTVVLAGALLAGALSAVPVLGNLLDFVVATVGLGAVVLDWQD